MKNLVLTIGFISIWAIAYSQQKKYYNTAINPHNVYFNTHIDTQIVYNALAPRQAKLYLLDEKEFQDQDTINKKGFGEITLVLEIGNPDSQIVYDSDWELEFPYGYDTAYLYKESPYVTFNSKSVRDVFVTYSKNKKTIHFKASYVGAGYKLFVLVFIPYWKNSIMTFHRLGKLF